MAQPGQLPALAPRGGKAYLAPGNPCRRGRLLGPEMEPPRNCLFHNNMIRGRAADGSPGIVSMCYTPGESLRGANGYGGEIGESPRKGNVGHEDEEMAFGRRHGSGDGGSGRGGPRPGGEPGSD